MKNTNEELHSAVRNGNISVVINLLNHGAEVNYKDSFDNDALFYSVVHCQKDIFNLLLKKGASLNTIYKEDKNILHIAIETECEENGVFEIIEVLLESVVDINTKDKYGNTPLGYACIYYAINKNTIELLLKKGANMDIKNNFGMSDYSSAKENNRSELIEILDKYRK